MVLDKGVLQIMSLFFDKDADQKHIFLQDYFLEQLLMASEHWNTRHFTLPYQNNLPFSFCSTIWLILICVRFIFGHFSHAKLCMSKNVKKSQKMFQECFHMFQNYFETSCHFLNRHFNSWKQKCSKERNLF